jgi:hypothetical protein
VTEEEARRLAPGLYRIRWLGNPRLDAAALARGNALDPGLAYSIASVGIRADGSRWIAPCDWTRQSTPGDDVWPSIVSIDPILESTGSGRPLKQALSHGERTLSARRALDVLMARLGVACDQTHEAFENPLKAGAIAAQWIEHELAPALAAYQDFAAIGTLWICPTCLDGEYLTQIHAERTYSVKFSCGHAILVHPVQPRRGPPNPTPRVVPLNSGNSVVPPGETVQVVAVAWPRSPVAIDRLVIANAERWTVLDLQIGGVQQLDLPSGELDGIAFARDRAESFIAFGILRPRDEIAIVARYNGFGDGSQTGEVFSASLVVAGETVELDTAPQPDA